MGSGGIFHKFWCDKCQCYVNFSDFETCESICEYCEAKENKARAEAAEAEVGRLRAELATMPRPEDRCNGEWPCEASTALAFAEAEMARAEAHAEAAEAEIARLRADLAKARADAEATRVAATRDRDRMRGNVDAWRDRTGTAEAAGRAAERAAVVAWLRGGARTHRGFGIRLIADELEKYADSIERGDHCKEE